MWVHLRTELLNYIGNTIKYKAETESTPFVPLANAVFNLPPRSGQNLWAILCFVLTFLCCFGLLFLACFAFKKSAKKRAVDIESTEEEVPVLTSAPHSAPASVAPRELHFARPMPPIPPTRPMAMEPVTIQRTPVTAVTAVTYRIEPKRVPVQPEPSEPVASGV